MSKAVLLLNLGTPSKPETSSIRKYLTEFLLDPRVLDINPIKRNLLVRGLIAPRRAPQLTKIYKSIWTEKGSPLLANMLSLQEKLQAKLGSEYIVECAMRYQKPALLDALKRLEKQSLDELILFPLFPQYASATTGSVLEKALKHITSWTTIPKLRVITEFCDNPGFIDAHAHKLQSIGPFEKLIVSFHGLPERQLQKANEECLCTASCCSRNISCYRAHCRRTYNALLKRLGRTDENTLLTFQSRFGKDPWIGPDTQETAIKLAQDGVKRIAIISPSFTMDCIETLYELGQEVRHKFIESGGSDCLVAPSLNDSPEWIETVWKLIQSTPPQ